MKKLSHLTGKRPEINISRKNLMIMIIIIIIIILIIMIIIMVY